MNARKLASRVAFALILGGLSVMGATAQQDAVANPVPKCANTECVGVSFCEFRSGRYCVLTDEPSCSNHVCAVAAEPVQDAQPAQLDKR